MASEIVKRRKPVDYDNAILALPARKKPTFHAKEHVMHPAGIVQQQNPANAREDILVNNPAATNDVFDIPLNNQPIDLPDTEEGVPKEINDMNTENRLDEQTGVLQEHNLTNAIEDIAIEPQPSAVIDNIFEFAIENPLMDLRNIRVYNGEDPTGFDQQPNAMINEQHIPQEQAATDHIFDFPIKNQLIDLDSDDSLDI